MKTRSFFESRATGGMAISATRAAIFPAIEGQAQPY